MTTRRPHAFASLSPVVQDVEFVGRRRAGLFEISNCPDDFKILHVAGRIIFRSDYQNTPMQTTGSLDQQMKVLKIIMVPGQEDQIVLDEVSSRSLVTSCPTRLRASQR